MALNRDILIIQDLSGNYFQCNGNKIEPIQPEVVDNGDGTFTWTPPVGPAVTWDVTLDDVGLQVQDTNSVDLTLTGTGPVSDPFIVSADVILDPNALNILSVGPNGLLALETITTASYDAGTHVITYTNESGTPVALDLNVGSIAYNGTTNTITYTDEEGTATTLPLNNVTVTNTVSGNLIATITNELGAAVNVNETITSVGNFTLNPGTNVLSFEYTDEAGVVNTPSVDLSTLAVDINVASVTFDAGTNILTVTETDSTTHPIDLTDLVDTYTLVNNGDGTFQVNDTGGTASGAIIDVCALITDGGCNWSVLGNVNADTDAPADCSLAIFDAADSQWHAWDPSTSTLNCANLGL